MSADTVTGVTSDSVTDAVVAGDIDEDGTMLVGSNTETVGWSTGFVGNIDSNPLSFDMIPASLPPPLPLFASWSVVVTTGCSCCVGVVTVGMVTVTGCDATDDDDSGDIVDVTSNDISWVEVTMTGLLTAAVAVKHTTTHSHSLITDESNHIYL